MSGLILYNAIQRGQGKRPVRQLEFREVLVAELAQEWMEEKSVSTVPRTPRQFLWQPQGTARNGTLILDSQISGNTFLIAIHVNLDRLGGHSRKLQGNGQLLFLALPGTQLLSLPHHIQHDTCQRSRTLTDPATWAFHSLACHTYFHAQDARGARREDVW